MKAIHLSRNIQLASLLDLLDALIRSRLTRGVGFLTIFALVATGSAFLHLTSYGFDYWQHLAAIGRIATNVLSPPPLFFNVDYQVHLYTPYHVFWGLILWLTGANLLAIASMASMSNVIIFFVGCRLLARKILGDPRYDLLVSVTLLFLWGHPIWWSGVYSFGQLPVQAFYPSFFAFALSLVTIGWVSLSALRSGYGIALLVVAIATVFLSHPVTATALILGVGLWLLVEARRPIHDLLVPSAAIACALGLGLLWPYFSVPTLVLAAGETKNFFGDPNAFYANVFNQIGFSIIGIAGMLASKPSRARAFCLSFTLTCLSIWIANYFLHISSVFSRYLIFSVLGMQCLALLGAIQARGPTLRMVLMLGLLFGLTQGVLTQSRIAAWRLYGPYWDFSERVSLGTHSIRNQYKDLEAIRHVWQGHETVAMVPARMAYPVAAMTGFNVVAVKYYAPTMPRYLERKEDSSRFFDNGTSCYDRRRILRKWSAKLIVIEARSKYLDALESCGWRAIFEGRDFVGLDARGSEEGPKADSRPTGS